MQFFPPVFSSIAETYVKHMVYMLCCCTSIRLSVLRKPEAFLYPQTIKAVVFVARVQAARSLTDCFGCTQFGSALLATTIQSSICTRSPVLSKCWLSHAGRDWSFVGPNSAGR